MNKSEEKAGKHIYLRDRMEKWNDRLWAFVDLSYLATAGAGFLFAKLALLAKLLPATKLKDDRKNDA
ncbi:hypothetical protein [Aminobacter sp. HY435]|uniref:hypothetical protein n=1 Tax=Aminobacter sp. HY435 TaxID=2970917 RepID=UPI0022B94801|nr:hypothetical protein [Aminobacter sp. HY435]